MSSSPLPRHHRLTRAAALTAAALVTGAVLTACGGGDDTADENAGAPAGPTIVASTTVYADIAEQVAGGNATVESVISDAAADPHSYEASPADAAAVTDADLVVYNGAGYDSFVDRALGNAADVPVVRAVDEYARVTGETIAEHSHGEESEEHGDDHDDEHGEVHDDEAHGHDSETNEHVWFSLPTAAAVAERVAEELAEIDEANAEEYRDNARRFADGLTPLEEQIDEIHDRGHFPYAQTERIGAHLFDAAHMVDLTPSGFLASVEDDTDPSAADLSATLDLIDESRVAFLAFNTQTETAVTARVREAAESADVAVVDLAETLPEDADYTSWMTDIVDSLSSALQGATPVSDGGH
ncbi:metal ABC transporter solute-binding protein, Zn/Mn family [Dietzia sp. PP-33]|jgi:zinc/manganese transport system substrate-binding protein|uniref:metal ABC transporter solute-binding protein, Zn/Mn family n=1 Tax=Dietzia sp. PP-33 TaxID=2957500 RepID=UPI0029B2095A|nr:zinc ABC transporter substrate-binding protein [Dietzia sp. PP-33]MDX2357007.1 zinc ABC transporter substrate-binding protein [Dietzia sp. PP-33]